MSDQPTPNKQTKGKARKIVIPIVAALAGVLLIGFAIYTGNKEWGESRDKGEQLFNQIINGSNSINDDTSSSSTKTESKSSEVESEEEPASTSSETVSQKNAVRKAKDYLKYLAYSHDGLVKQLEFEQFSHADAVYGADNCGADWNEQAALKAQDYLDVLAYSRGGLIDQLLFEGFTQAQAEYGANAVGL